MALIAGSMIIPAFRWWWLLRIQGLQEPAWKVVSLTWAGYLAGLVLPGTAGAGRVPQLAYLATPRSPVPEHFPRFWRIAFWDYSAYSLSRRLPRVGCCSTKELGAPFR